ncbi:hypothetical protein BC567DRAFT_222526, partial [Phyllosticta citribraziliensis]
QGTSCRSWMPSSAAPRSVPGAGAVCRARACSGDTGVRSGSWLVGRLFCSRCVEDSGIVSDGRCIPEVPTAAWKQTDRIAKSTCRRMENCEQEIWRTGRGGSILIKLP